MESIKEKMTAAIEAVIPEIVEKLEDDNRIFWRADDFLPECGADFDDSTRWDDGVKTEESIGGLCCTNYITTHDRVYYGRYIFAVTGREEGYGEDDDEVIVAGHGVLAAYDRKEDRVVYVNPEAIWPSWGY